MGASGSSPARGGQQRQGGCQNLGPGRQQVEGGNRDPMEESIGNRREWRFHKALRDGNLGATFQRENLLVLSELALTRSSPWRGST